MAQRPQQVWKAVLANNAEAIPSGTGFKVLLGDHVGFLISTAGDLSLKFRDNSTAVVPVPVGVIPLQAIEIVLDTTTAEGSILYIK